MQRIAFISIIVLLPAMRARSTLAQFEIDWFTVDGGGGRMVGGVANLELSATIGQPDAGTLTGGDFELTGGFWFAIPPGDCNSTGSVTLPDHAVYAECLTGPDAAMPDAACACVDFDGDNDVDLLDFAELQNAFGGA